MPPRVMVEEAERLPETCKGPPTEDEAFEIKPPVTLKRVELMLVNDAVLETLKKLGM